MKTVVESPNVRFRREAGLPDLTGRRLEAIDAAFITAITGHPRSPRTTPLSATSHAP